MRYCKLDWKPDAGIGPRIFSGTRVMYDIVAGVPMDAHQAAHFPVLMALLAKDVGLDEDRVEAMVTAGRLEGIVQRTER